MTMYLPNPDLHPTGAEPGEFIEPPARAELAVPPRAALARQDRATVGLDLQTRLNIARWAQEYISGLVETHDGDARDVRSIIHQLHDGTALDTARDHLLPGAGPSPRLPAG